MRRGALALLLLGALLPVGAGGAVPSSAQEGGSSPRATASIEPDTVRVGEPFTLGVTVDADSSVRLEFPMAIPAGEGLEQRAPAEVRRDPATGVRRAYYRLVAWETGDRRVTPFEILVRDGEAERRLQVRPPAVHVATVLPEAEEELELRAARPFLERTGFPWWWLALGVAVAALLAAWLWRRRTRRADEPAPVPVEGPAGRALRELEALREAWRTRALREPELYDRLAGTLRGYAEATRSWPAGRPLGELADGDRPLRRALDRSALVRFARLHGQEDEPPEALSACAAWVRSDALRPGGWPAATGAGGGGGGP